jgi:hypothetical protein
MNGCHVLGNQGLTEPGLQANWQKSPPPTARRPRFGPSFCQAAETAARKLLEQLLPGSCAARHAVPKTALETGLSNHSLSLTAYQ